MEKAVAGVIAQTCPSPETLCKRLADRMQPPRSPIAPEQLQTLLTLADEKPEELAVLFKGQAAVPAIRAHLLQEQAKHDASLRIARQHQETKELTPEVKTRNDTDAWVTFVQHYRQLLHDTQHPDSDGGAKEAERLKSMRASNPFFVLRPWTIQKVVEAAEAGRYDVVQQLADRVLKPYEVGDERDEKLWPCAEPPGCWPICLSCSS